MSAGAAVIRIRCVDDHPLLRGAIVALVDGVGGEFVDRCSERVADRPASRGPRDTSRLVQEAAAIGRVLRVGTSLFSC
jgi:hypothetical protein